MDGFDAEVAVVGAGPVGCVLALLLADRGHRVALVERHRAPYPLPRAVHFDHETARILQAVGLGEVLPDLSEPAHVYEWQNGAGETLLRFDMADLGVSGWPVSSFFNQPDLEAELHARVDAHPCIEVHRGAIAVGLSQDGDGVRLDVADADGGAGASISTRFLVGCDGANSFVRATIDPPMEDHGFFFDWLIVDVALHRPRTFEPENLQVCDPHRPTTVISGGPGRRRWEFMCLPGEALDALDEEARAWELLAAWDVTSDDATLVRHAGYRFQARWATRWRDGRVFLAGDAAHLTPPFAGQGMCAGLRDAANLAWKLDLVLAGTAGDDLLDTYEAERLPHAAAVIGLAVDLGKVICVPDPAEAEARDAAMIPQFAAGGPILAPGLPPLVDGVVLGGTPGAGELFAQGVVEVDGERGRFDDRTGGTGWVLVGTPEAIDALPAAEAAWFAGLGGRCIAVAADAAVGVDAVDVDGTYRAWFADHGACAALQRPDLHVFGTAATPAQAGTLVGALRERLS